MTRLTQLEKGIMVLLVAAMVMLPACTTLDPYTQEEKTSNAEMTRLNVRREH